MSREHLDVLCKWIVDSFQYYDNLSSIKDYLLFVFCIILIVLWLLGLDKKVLNSRSEEQIRKLVSSKKYIRGLFVELSECKEYLRFFANRKKWKKRLVREYNTLFMDYEGIILKDTFPDEQLNLVLSKKYSLEEIIRIISHTRDFLNKLHDGEISIPERYEESLVRFRYYGNRYDENLQELLVKAQMMNTSYCVLVGSAGNGKTNMLCSFSELLISQGKRCIFVNGKDIEQNVEKYLRGRISLPRCIDYKSINSLYFLFLKVLNKELYYVIDAINENENDISDELVSFINKYQKYKNIRIIISCRSEYFQARFKNDIVDRIDIKPVCIDLMDSSYSKNALHRLFTVYCRAYNYTGTISNVVKEKLCKQLLTMRIFFEINEGKNRNYYDLNTHSLIKEYIEKIEKDTKSNVSSFLDEISERMIQENNYSEVCYSLLSEEGKHIQDVIEDTILTSKTYLVNEGRLLEDKELVVHFVYDEVRDYCLAKAFLRKANTTNNVTDIGKLTEIIDDLIKKKAVCTEGVVKYIYRDAHMSDNNELCNLIITKYADDIDGNIRRWRDSLSWTLQLILDTSDDLLDCEKDYITRIVREHNARVLSHFFTFLIEQERDSGRFTLDLILDTVRDVPLEGEVRSIVSKCVSNFGNGTIGHNDFIEVDKSLKNSGENSLARFREFVLLYSGFFDWEGKEAVINYYKSKNIIDSIINKIKNEYVFLRRRNGLQD